MTPCSPWTMPLHTRREGWCFCDTMKWQQSGTNCVLKSSCLLQSQTSLNPPPPPPPPSQGQGQCDVCRHCTQQFGEMLLPMVFGSEVLRSSLTFELWTQIPNHTAAMSQPRFFSPNALPNVRNSPCLWPVNA